jgi:hypothetical protein
MIQNRLSKYPVQILKYKTKTQILKKTWANPEDVPKTHLFKTSRFQKKSAVYIFVAWPCTYWFASLFSTLTFGSQGSS